MRARAEAVFVDVAVTKKWKSSLKGILQKMLPSFFKVGKIRAYLQVEEKQRQEKHRADGGRSQRGARRMDPCLGGLYPGKEHPFPRQEERVANNPEQPQVGGVRGLSYCQAPTL